MADKHEIRKVGDTWYLARPMFGFRPYHEVLKCASWKDAMSKVHGNSGSSSQHVDRTSTPEHRDYRWGPRWPLIIR